jgi:hypothetical protein
MFKIKPNRSSLCAGLGLDDAATSDLLGRKTTSIESTDESALSELARGRCSDAGESGLVEGGDGVEGMVVA